MRDAIRALLRLLLMGIFVICCLFWISVGFYTIRGLLTHGAAGVPPWFIHIDLGHSDALTYVPHWGFIAARLAVIALLTFLLWGANRRFIKELMSAFRGHAAH